MGVEELSHSADFVSDPAEWPLNGSLVPLIDPVVVVERFRSIAGDLDVDWDCTVDSHAGVTRSYASLEELSKARGNLLGVTVGGRLGGIEVLFGFGNVSHLGFYGGSEEHDGLFLDLADAMARVIAFGNMAIAVGDNPSVGSNGAHSAGFPQAYVDTERFATHSPVMYFNQEQAELLDSDALSRVRGVRTFESENGLITRVDVCPVRENPLAMRDLAFDLTAPVRTERSPVFAAPAGSIRYTSLSSIEVALTVVEESVVDRFNLPDWHPDAEYQSGPRTYEALLEWQAGFDDHLRLNDAIRERAGNIELPPN